MLLAKDGIFPITKDRYGQLLTETPASGFTFPGTIQGEGKLCGVPSLFIRLAGCNLHCQWKTTDGGFSQCDTTYAAYEIKDAHKMDTEAIYETIMQNSEAINHIVITGGEPLLQLTELKSLCYKLKQNNKFHLTIETNATIFDENVAQYIDLFSMSPKLTSSQGNQSAVSLDVICAYINYALKHNKDFQLKFVYSCENDIDEIEKILSNIEGWHPEDILLMPLGGTVDIMRRNCISTLKYCIRNGWRYCDRLHISLFGDRAGV